jgi:hypothetical protein
MTNPFERRQQPGKSGNPFQPASGPNGAPVGKPKPTNKPTAIKPDFESIPTELRERPNWVLWGYLPPEKPGGKWRKVPFQPNGREAKINVRRTWSEFDVCCAAYEQGRFDGIGFVFDGAVGADGLCLFGIDFDDCIINGEITPHIKAWIKKLDTYTERSVGGTGIHCICRGEPLDLTGAKITGIEIYNNARYFTFTGEKSGKIKIATTEVPALVAEVRVRAKKAREEYRHPSPDNLIAFKPRQPDPAFAHLDPNEHLGEVIESSHWFDLLQPEQKDEVLEHGCQCIASNGKFELEANGGNNAEYHTLVTSIARSGAPHALDIFIKYASNAKDADTPDKLEEHFARAKTPRSSGPSISIGTFIYIAQECGANFDKWKQQEQGEADVPPLTPQQRSPLQGGYYSKKDAIKLINSHFFIGRRSDEPAAIHRINDDGSLTYYKVSDLSLEVANIVVIGHDGTASAFWKAHRERRQHAIAFETHGTTDLKKYNLWRGFGVEPREGKEKRRSLLQHIWKVICREDDTKFEYMIRWMAWKVQNPDKHPETVPVIKGDDEGGGKTIVSDVMRMIFGRHATVITHQMNFLVGLRNFSNPCAFFKSKKLYGPVTPNLPVE